jgi:hypothetical protein
MKLRYIPEDEKTTPQGKSAEPKPISRDQWQKIAYAIRIGGNLHDAAAYARISYGRLYRNIEAERHLKRDVNELMVKCKFHHLRRVYKGEKGWQSSAWFLERMYRKEFALNLPPGTSDEEKAIQMRKVIRRQGPIPRPEPSNN